MCRGNGRASLPHVLLKALPGTQIDSEYNSQSVTQTVGDSAKQTPSQSIMHACMHSFSQPGRQAGGRAGTLMSILRLSLVEIERVSGSSFSLFAGLDLRFAFSAWWEGGRVRG